MDDLFRSVFGFRRTQSRNQTPGPGTSPKAKDPFPADPEFGEPGFPDRTDGDEEDLSQPGGSPDSHGADNFHFQSPDGAFTFSFHFPEPDQMFRHFEEIFRNIGLSEFPPGQPGLPAPQEPNSPRDEMLKKPDNEKPTLFGQPWELPPWERSRPQQKEDFDLDKDVESNGIDSFLRDRQVQPYTHEPEKPKASFGYRSVSIRTIHGPDGRIEEHQTVDDGSNRQTTVKRILGDRSHSVTTEKDKSGKLEKIEDFTNLDEKDLGTFDQEWQKNSQRHTVPRSDINLGGDAMDDKTKSIFKNIFGFSFPGFSDT